MTETLLNQDKKPDPKPGDIDPKTGIKIGDIDPKTGEPFPTDERPENIPEKFWDKEKKDVNTEALLKSYVELEKLIGKKKEEKTPDTYENVPESLAEHFKEINLTSDQASGIMKLLSESIVPNLAREKEQIERDKLKAHWGLKDNDFAERITKISEWAKGNLDSDVLAELATTSHGILAIEAQMIAMNKKNQSNIGDDTKVKTVTKQMIHEMLADPRYETSREFRDEVYKLAQQIK